MLDIYWEVDGKRVKPGNVGDALEQAMYQKIADSVKEELESVRCAEHCDRPTVIFQGRGVNELKFKVEGCCDELIDTATEQLE